MDELKEGIISALERIADVQEKLLEIAQEAREERKSIGEKMKENFRTGFRAIPPSEEK